MFKKHRSLSVVSFALLCALMMTICAGGLIGEAAAVSDEPIYSAGGFSFSTGRDAVAIPAENIPQLASIDSGTIFMEFTPTSMSTANSLISLSDSSHTDAHIHVYIDNRGFLGIEVRNAGESTYLNLQAPAEVSLNTSHMMALTADPVDGYKFYFDGALAFHMPISLLASWNYDYRFMSTVENINVGYIGATYRAGTLGYPYYGTIDRVEVYDIVLSDQTLKNKTYIEKDPGIIKQENVFSFEDWNTNGIRIPSILRTSHDTIIATGDIRFGNAGGGSNDPPNNCDVGIRVSSDGGQSWSDPKMLVNFLDYPNEALNYLPRDSASYCDSVLVEGQNGRVFFFCDAMPGNVRATYAAASSGYTDDGYLILIDSSGKQYELHEDTGTVYLDGTATDYTVGDDFTLYKNGVQAGNIFYTNYGDYVETDIPRKTELRVIGTVFLVMCYSDDGGYTWSAPKLMNYGFKTNNEKHYGTAPGIGIVIKNGLHAGRILVPIYYNSASYSGLSGAVLYSDDNGLTWHRGESPNDARAAAGMSKVSMGEIQIVEMPSEGESVSSQLKMFVRQSGGVLIATSYDGGETWAADMPRDSALVAPTPYGGCQQSVINYSQKVDGRDAVIFANAAANSRSNGTVRIGLIEDNGLDANGRVIYTFDWAYHRVIRAGEFGYSALMEMPNGNIVCFYEQESRPDNIHSLVFGEYTMDYLKDIDPATPNIVYHSSDLSLPIDGNYPSIPETDLTKIAGLHEGTIIVRFTPETTSTPNSLIGISNGQEGQQNSYFTLYYTHSRIGFEIRQQTGGDYEKKYASVSIEAGKEYCVALVADKDYGYKLFLNGALVLDCPMSDIASTLGYGFIDNVPGVDSGYLGKTRRVAPSSLPTANEYPFTGFIDELLIYDKPLSSTEMLSATYVAPKSNQVYSAKNKTISQASDAVAMNETEVAAVAALDSGTIVVEFTPSQLSSIHSLIGISNNEDGQQNSHFHLYVASGRLGYEIRRQEGGDFEKSVASVSMDVNKKHIVAFAASEEGGYKLFCDGELVQRISPSEYPSTGYGFISSIPGINSGYIGKTDRGSGGYSYQFYGTISNIKVYSDTISDDTLAAWTNYGGF